ncbi:hypothetical protein JSO62_00005, partial [Riemerella anatipestifer]|uniref:hypothetical protein n=1 Tax=Riemerella anatipestifer TaxID=34085 RepID=UPI0030C0293D
MNRLEEIHGLLPDNDNAEISEKDLRDSFSKTFEEIKDVSDKSIKKPTSTITQPNTSFKYALLLDEEGNSTKMLAGDLGKNLANSKPNNTPN